MLIGCGGLVTARAETTKAVPFAAYTAEVAQVHQLIIQCAQNADACHPENLPGREQVQGGPNGSFYSDWIWLGEAFGDAKPAKTADRVKLMQRAQTHLDEVAKEAGTQLNADAASFGKAHDAAQAILRRDEFRTEQGPTWFEKQLARLQDWVLRLFTGMDRLGRRAPWLAPAIEWGCFGLAAAGLLWFIRQSLARQALQISLTEGASLATRGDRDSADWARLAQERAAAGDWREAVHCLYWAAIALMENRRAWKPNATRTPREYLRLLKPGSPAQTALRSLTRVFERIWYGHGQADADAYEAALSSFRALEAARPERSDVHGANRPVSGALNSPLNSPGSEAAHAMGGAG